MTRKKDLKRKNKLEKYSYLNSNSKKLMSPRNNSSKVTLEVTEKVSVATQVSVGIIIISALIAGFGLFALFSLPIQEKQELPPAELKTPPTVSYLPGGVFITNQVLVKFKPNLIESEKETTINNNLKNPVEAIINKNTGEVMQSSNKGLPQKELPEGAELESREITAALKTREKVMKIVPETNRIGLDRWELISMDTGTDIAQVVARMEKDANIEYAEPNYLAEAMLAPNDQFYQEIEKLGVCTGTTNGWYDGDRCYQNSNCPGGSCDKSTNTIPVQWGLDKLNAQGAWDEIYNTPIDLITVAVIDTGVDYNHLDIVNNIFVNQGEVINGVDDDGNGYIDDVKGWDFSTCKKWKSDSFGSYICDSGDIKDEDNDPMDDFWHGTHVAGIISSMTNNATGLASISGGWHPAKPGVKVMALKGLDQQGRGLMSELAGAINYAANWGVEVINLSWGFRGYSQLLADTVSSALNQGSFIVAAAGNSKEEALLFAPANLDGVLTVAATNENDARWDDGFKTGSNAGANVDVSAPGKDVISLKASAIDSSAKNIVDGYYYYVAGTSQAAPHVAALAALILARHPEFTNEQLESIIKMGADDVENFGWDPYTGQGRLNAYQSLKILNPLISQINSPSNFENYTLGDSITIAGSTGGIDFQSYQVEYIKGDMTGSWTQIFTSNSPVTNGILATWNTAGIAGGSYYLRVTATDTSGRKLSDHRLINITYPFQAGNWPGKQIDNWILSSLTFADLDENPSNGLEIMFPSQELNQASGEYEVFAWHHDGSDVSGSWPVDTGYNGFNVKSISVADLDQDGEKEAIGISGLSAYVWQADGTLNTAWDWPKSWPKNRFSFSAPAIANLEGDMDLEIIFTRYPYEVVAYHHNGSAVWENPISAPGTNPTVPALASTPALADLDNDMDQEIVIASTGKIYVFHHNDGNNDGYADQMTGWPRSAGAGETYSSPAIADLDQDGDLEIIAAYSKTDSKIYAFHHDGTPVTNWPKQTGAAIYSSPAIADLDPSYPGLEIVIGSSDRKVYAWHSDGSNVSGWPKETNGEVTSSPIMADLDGNGDLEIAVGSEDGKFYVWHHDGTNYLGFPVTTTASISFSPAIGDLDNDRDLEIGVVNQNGKIYIWDLPSRYTPHKLPWPMFHHDSRHTGLYNQCEDYTLSGQCSEITMQYCDNVELVYDCSKCNYCTGSTICYGTGCVQCVSNSDCPSDKICKNYYCVTPPTCKKVRGRYICEDIPSAM